MHENARSVILHEMTNYHLCMNSVKTSNNGCRLKRLRVRVNVLTRKGRNVVTRALPGLARTLHTQFCCTGSYDNEKSV